MPFIGNQPAEAYSSFQKQDFTTSATTSYTLDHPVSNGNEIALFINFVRQEPTTAYSASGTSLTLTSATTSSDDMYCVYLGKAVQTVNPPNSSVGNSQLDVSAINSQTAETSIAGGDEVLIYDTSASALRKMTRTNFVSGIGGTNTPAFMSQISANQSISHDTVTKINFNTKIFDTDTNFDTTNKRFTPTTSGKYFLSCNISLTGTNNRDYFYALSFYKNGSEVFGIQTGDELTQGTDFGMSTNCVVDANGSSDYFEMYIYSYDYSGSGSISLIKGTQPRTFFHGYKIIE